MNNDLTKRISGVQLEAFHARMLLLLESGMPLPDGIRKLAGEVRDPQFRLTLTTMAEGLAGGETLSEAMTKDKRKRFPPDYVALIRVGEAGDDLAHALELALEQETFQRNFRDRLKRALLYPGLVFVMVAAAYLTTLIMSYPLFLDVLEATGAKASWITNVAPHVYKIAIAAAAGLVLLALISMAPGPKRALHQALLRAPLLGSVLVARFLASFSQGLSIMLQAGVPLADALELLAKVTANRSLAAQMETAATQAREGETLESVLARIELVPELYVATVGAGAEAGVLPDSLAGLAEMYREETEYSAKTFLQLLDTAMVVGLGGWVGLMLVGFFDLYVNLVMSIDYLTVW